MLNFGTLTYSTGSGSLRFLSSLSFTLSLPYRSLHPAGSVISRTFDSLLLLVGRVVSLWSRDKKKFFIHSLDAVYDDYPVRFTPDFQLRYKSIHLQGSLGLLSLKSHYPHFRTYVINSSYTPKFSYTLPSLISVTHIC